MDFGRIHATCRRIRPSPGTSDFVVVALREALSVSDGVLVQGARQRPLYLDVAGRISLLPDLSLWEGLTCRFVGDIEVQASSELGIS